MRKRTFPEINRLCKKMKALSDTIRVADGERIRRICKLANLALRTPQKMSQEI
jgi:hypothetical protein